MLRRSALAVLPAFLLALYVSSITLSAQTPQTLWIRGDSYRLKSTVYVGSRASSTPDLVIVLHGDAPFAKPSYQDSLAQRIAARFPGTVAAAILRPGYTDPEGNTSDGIRGQTTGDNYNATNTDALAAVIDSLKARFHARKVVLVGHSGGSAISANILGRHPSLADAALLVSCPCDVTAWRAHMLTKTKFAGFEGPISTLSPIDLVAGVSAKVPVVMMVGDSDDVAPPELTRTYEAKAKELGKTIHVVLVHGGHEIFLRPEVLEELGKLL